MHGINIKQDRTKYWTQMDKNHLYQQCTKLIALKMTMLDLF